MTITAQTLYQKIFKIWRRKRFELFLKYISPSLTDKLLDVGGYPSSWTSYPKCVRSIVSLNIHEVSWQHETAPEYNIQTIVGDGCALPDLDYSYDIGFSNSVIEHVGSWERQKQFAVEIRRVAKSIWVQTPAYECPIEPHYLTPLIHYLPKPIQKKILRWVTIWGLLNRPDQKEIDHKVNTTRLLRKSEVMQLFPDCEIITERMLLFIPKSYIAFRRKSSIKKI